MPKTWEEDQQAMKNRSEAMASREEIAKVFSSQKNGEEWINLYDGTQIVDADGNKSYDSYALKSNELNSSAEYGVNNGQIAVRSEGGMQWAPYSEEREEALKRLGYKKGGVGVPFSSGGKVPENAELLDKMRELIDKQRILNERKAKAIMESQKALEDDKVAQSQSEDGDIQKIRKKIDGIAV